MLDQRCELLRSLHVPGTPLVLPNAWDAASAKVVVAAGFPVVATTSGGVAACLGYEDHEDAPAEEMLAAATRIAASVDVPVTVDAEAGYGLTLAGSSTSIAILIGSPRSARRRSPAATSLSSMPGSMSSSRMAARNPNTRSSRRRLLAHARTEKRASTSFVEAVQMPVNILALPQAPPIARLADVGVARVSYGSMFHQRSMREFGAFLDDLPR